MKLRSEGQTEFPTPLRLSEKRRYSRLPLGTLFANRPGVITRGSTTADGACNRVRGEPEISRTHDCLRSKRPELFAIVRAEFPRTLFREARGATRTAHRD